MDVAFIYLQQEINSLNDVTVTAKKPLLEQKIDRLIINVDNSITSSRKYCTGSIGAFTRCYCRPSKQCAIDERQKWCGDYDEW